MKHSQTNANENIAINNITTRLNN